MIRCRPEGHPPLWRFLEILYTRRLIAMPTCNNNGISIISPGSVNVLVHMTLDAFILIQNTIVVYFEWNFRLYYNTIIVNLLRQSVIFTDSTVRWQRTEAEACRTKIGCMTDSDKPDSCLVSTLTQLSALWHEYSLLSFCFVDCLFGVVKVIIFYYYY